MADGGGVTMVCTFEDIFVKSFFVAADDHVFICTNSLSVLVAFYIGICRQLVCHVQNLQRLLFQVF